MEVAEGRPIHQARTLLQHDHFERAELSETQRDSRSGDTAPDDTHSET